MKVKDLIKKLAKMPQDKEVFIDDSSLIYIELNDIHEYRPVISFDPYILSEETIVIISSK